MSDKEETEKEKIRAVTLSAQLKRTSSSRIMILPTVGTPRQLEAAQHGKDKFLKFLNEYQSNDLDSIMHSIVDHFEFNLARTKYTFERHSLYQAAAFSLRDRIIEHWNDTQELMYSVQAKRAYYLSIEFLLGRTLTNALISTGLAEPFANALKEFGESMETIADREQDAALGSGGLGRLAACFLDSLATMNFPV